MEAPLYFEDIEPGTSLTGPSVTVDKDELVAFARAWDPHPFHMDDEAGKKAFGGITAPGIYVLALKQRLTHGLPRHPAVIAAMGYDELRFFKPVRPGDTLTLRIDWIEKRLSRTKPDRGVVVHRLSLVDQDGETAMSHLDTILVRLRKPGEGTTT